MQPTYHNVSINNTENPHSVTGNKKPTCNATLFTNVNKHVITTYKHSKNSIKLTGTHKNTEKNYKCSILFQLNTEVNF